MSEIVLEENFKQNRIGTMAGNHPEILSEEPKCWLRAAAWTSKDGETHRGPPGWHMSLCPSWRPHHLS